MGTMTDDTFFIENKNGGLKLKLRTARLVDKLVQKGFIKKVLYTAGEITCSVPESEKEKLQDYVSFGIKVYRIETKERKG